LRENFDFQERQYQTVVLEKEKIKIYDDLFLNIK
jgi:hypothetical protein